MATHSSVPAWRTPWTEVPGSHSPWDCRVRHDQEAKHNTGSSSGTEPACHAGDVRGMGLVPGTGRAVEEGMATHSSVLAWESHGQRSLVGYSP